MRGGVLTVKSDELASLVPGLRHNGHGPFGFEREHYWIPAMSNVDLPLEGVYPHNFCISEVQCALGSKLLERVDEMNAARTKRAIEFREAMKEFEELSFQKFSADYNHVYHLLSAKYESQKAGKQNHDLIKLLAYKYGIKAIVQYYPLYRYSLFQKLGFSDYDCPNTDDFYDNMVSFPFHLWMSDEDFDYMINCTIDALTELRKK